MDAQKYVLSVICPIYKTEAYLNQCINSIVHQTMDHIEILLVDDGSPDGCGKICNKYADQYDNIRVFHTINKGQSAARNLGIEKARGEWITFIDSDDWIDFDYYEKLFEEMEKNNSVDIFQSGGYIAEFVDYTEEVSAFSYPFYYTCVKNYSEIQFLMSRVMVRLYDKNDKKKLPTIGGPWDKLYRTNFIKQNKLYFDESLRRGEDLPFNIRALGCAASIGGCAYHGYHYRQREKEVTVSHGFRADMFEIEYSLIEEINKCLSSINSSERLWQTYHIYVILRIWNYINCFLFDRCREISYLEKKKEINKIKNKPLYADSIFSKNNRFFPYNVLLKKYVLRSKLIWPVHFLSAMNEILRKII